MIMEKYVSFLICVSLSVAVASDGYPKDTKQYRKDYEYDPKTDAFYKLHIESRHGSILQEICHIEGAELMNPRSEDDIVRLHIMFKKFPDLGDYVWVADDGLAHDSAEEQPLIDLNEQNEYYQHSSYPCVVVNRDGKVEYMPCYRSLPFICKVNARDAPYDPQCKVFAEDYKYYPSVGSCYKLPKMAYTWSEAYADCKAQGAHLVILNSETEREIVQNITLTEPKIPNTQVAWFFFAGFRSLPPPAPFVFKTILSFSQWSPNEPNNSNGREFCGTIFKNNGLLNDNECTAELGYLCENEIKYV